MFDTIPLILAQEDAPPTTNAPAPTTGEGANGGTQGQSTAPAQRPPGLFDGGLLFIMIAVLLIFMIFNTRSQRAERKKREELLAALKKGDRVKTIGGILGTVLEIRDNEVLLKVDENSNTRIRMDRSAIQTVLKDKE